MGTWDEDARAEYDTGEDVWTVESDGGVRAAGGEEGARLDVTEQQCVRTKYLTSIIYL